MDSTMEEVVTVMELSLQAVESYSACQRKNENFNRNIRRKMKSNSSIEQMIKQHKTIKGY